MRLRAGAERMSRVSSTQIRAIVAAEVVSSIGSSMTVLALPWFVLVTTGSATKLGLVLGIGSIPFVTLPLLAGSLIARIGARQTMVIADAARLPLLAAIPALYSLDALSFPLLVVLVALTNVFMAAHMPAQRLILARGSRRRGEPRRSRERVPRRCANDCAPRRACAGGRPDRRTRPAERAVRRCCHLRSRRDRRRLVRATEETDDRGRGARAACGCQVHPSKQAARRLVRHDVDDGVLLYAVHDDAARVRVFPLRPERPHRRCLLRRDGCRSAARDARRLGRRAPVRGAPRRRGSTRARVDPEAAARVPSPRGRGRRCARPAGDLRTADRRADLHRHHDAHTRSAPHQGAVRRIRGDVPHRAVRPDCRRSTDQRGRGKNGLRHRRGRIPGRVRAVRHLRRAPPQPGRSRRARVRRRTPGRVKQRVAVRAGAWLAGGGARWRLGAGACPEGGRASIPPDRIAERESRFPCRFRTSLNQRYAYARRQLPHWGVMPTNVRRDARCIIYAYRSPGRWCMSEANPIDPSPVSATHVRLVEAAAALFRAKGYAGTTTRELAGLVGIQNASMYHHIRSKDDLLHTVCVESLTRIRAAVEDALEKESEPLDRLRALIMAHLATSLADQDKHATMLTELRSLPPTRRAEVIALRDQYESLVGSVIHDAQEAGVVRADVAERQLTLALLNLLNWTIFWFRPDGGMEAQQIASVFLSIYFYGVVVGNP